MIGQRSTLPKKGKHKMRCKHSKNANSIDTDGIRVDAVTVYVNLLDEHIVDDSWMQGAFGLLPRPKPVYHPRSTVPV